MTDSMMDVDERPTEAGAAVIARIGGEHSGNAYQRRRLRLACAWPSRFSHGRVAGGGRARALLPCYPPRPMPL
jgi:hypothetical protein